MTTHSIRQHLMTCVMDDKDGGALTVTTTQGSVTVGINIPGIEPNDANPHIDITIPDTEQTTNRLDGGGLVEEGTVFAVAVARTGNTLDREFLYNVADTIAGKCPAGTILPNTGATTIQITARPSIGGLFLDGDEWRLPVSIRYRASKS